MGTGTSSALIASIVRTPTFRWGAGIAIVGGLLLAASATYVVSNAQSASCEIKHHEPLSIEQLIDVKKRFTRYKRNPESGLELRGDELSMLLEDRADVPVYVDIEGNRVQAQVAVPASTAGKCWPIDFKGELTVEEGVAYVVPSVLKVGDIDFSSIASGVRMELLPEHMPNARAAFFLEQTQSASITEDHVSVELLAPSEFSWSGKR